MRSLLSSALVAVASLMVVATVSRGDAAVDPKAPLWVFIGTYTGPKSKGIYRFEMDPDNGKLSGGTLVAETVNPSFLAVHPTKRFLYAVNEIDNFEGKKAGSVSAFGLDAKTGELKAINRESTVGDGPCHLIVDRSGKNVLVANYGGGSVCVLPIKEDGRVAAATTFIQHKGSGGDPARQEAAHAHSMNVDAANKFVVAADLGLDKLFVYKFDAEAGTLKPNDPAFVEIGPGTGPRHFAFHPTEPYAYVINELKSTVTAMTYDAEKGVLKPFQSISTLPKGGFKGDTSTAEVQVHPSGKFLYGSNRGQNSIVAYSIDPKTGKLTYIANQGAGVNVPRNFGIDPSGRFMMVANQAGDSVIVFRIDPETGKLTPTGFKVEVGSPVCVKFVARDK
jgi:6-phosphogluconolactonase